MERGPGALAARKSIRSRHGCAHPRGAARSSPPHAGSRTWPGRWAVRAAAVCLTLLVSLDLFLAGLVLIGRPAHPELNRRFAAGAQAAAFRAVADRTRQEWAGFRKRLEERAAGAR